MTTVAVISDTHLPRGSRVLPDRCVVLLRGADVIVHAGDIATLAVLEQLRSLGPPVHAVHGNVDEPALVAALPEELRVDVEDVRLGVVHDAGPAAGRLGRLQRRLGDCDAVVFGHSHIPLHEHDFDGAFQIFNPGSPTDRRRQPRHTMGLARVRGGDIGFELVALD
jgi:putative phosphoesterase